MQTRATFTGERQTVSGESPSWGSQQSLCPPQGSRSRVGGEGSGNGVGASCLHGVSPPPAQQCLPAPPPPTPTCRPEPQEGVPPTQTGLLVLQEAGPAPGRAAAAPAGVPSPVAATRPPGASPQPQTAVPLRHHPRLARGTGCPVLGSTGLTLSTVSATRDPSSTRGEELAEGRPPAPSARTCSLQQRPAPLACPPPPPPHTHLLPLRDPGPPPRVWTYEVAQPTWWPR